MRDPENYALLIKVVYNVTKFECLPNLILNNATNIKQLNNINKKLIETGQKLFSNIRTLKFHSTLLCMTSAHTYITFEVLSLVVQTRFESPKNVV